MTWPSISIGTPPCRKAIPRLIERNPKRPLLTDSSSKRVGLFHATAAFALATAVSMLDHWAAGVENVERYLAKPGRMLDKLGAGEVAVFDPGWPAPHAQIQE